jgi:hypothetical protein
VTGRRCELGPGAAQALGSSDSSSGSNDSSSSCYAHKPSQKGNNGRARTSWLVDQLSGSQARCHAAELELDQHRGSWLQNSSSMAAVHAGNSCLCTSLASATYKYPGTVAAAQEMLVLRAPAAHLAAGAAVSNFSCHCFDQRRESHSTNCSSCSLPLCLQQLKCSLDACGSAFAAVKCCCVLGGSSRWASSNTAQSSSVFGVPLLVAHAGDNDRCCSAVSCYQRRQAEYWAATVASGADLGLTLCCSVHSSSVQDLS